MRCLRLPLVAFLAASLVWPQENTVTFRSNSNLVVINVFVRDKSGKPVPGLKQSDFRLTENGLPQSLSVFEYQQLSMTPATSTATTAEPAPATPAAQNALSGTRRFRDRRLLVFYFDLSMQPADQQRAQEAAVEFLQNRLTESDVVSILTFSSRLNTVQDFTADRDLLVNTVKGLQAGQSLDISVSTAVTEDDTSTADAEDAEFDLFNTDRKLAGLETAVRSLAALPEKKAFVFFSTGTGKMGAENLSQLRSTVNEAVRANVSFYPIDVQGLIAMPPGGNAMQESRGGTGLFSGETQRKQRDDFNGQQETLYSLASDTGGKALLDSNDLALGIRQAQDDLQSYYTLGYYSANTAKDGKFRKVDVKLPGHPELKLDFRAGYYAEKSFKQFSSTDRERQLEDVLMLGDPVTDLPLALEIDYFRLEPGKYFIPVAVKIPGSELELVRKRGNDTAELDFIGQVKDERGKLVTAVRDAIKIKLGADAAAELNRKAILYDTGFALPKGRYTLKLVARENTTGKIGTFETTFDIPQKAPSSKMELSSVVWSAQREPVNSAIGRVDSAKKLLKKHPLVENGQKLVPNVTHVFRPTQNMFVYAEAYDPGPAVDVAASISFFHGKTRVFESAPVRVHASAEGRKDAVPLRFQVPLAQLKPGRYTCQVNIIDQANRRFAFERTPIVVLP